MNSTIVPLHSLYRQSAALLPRGPERSYWEYNYTAGYLLQLVREGACCGCGACCRSEIQLHAHQRDPRGYPMLGPEDFADDQYDRAGVWEAASDAAGWTYTAKLAQVTPGRPCPAHNSLGQCGCHFTNKPILCQEWPLGPAQAALFEECTYWFKPIRAWQLAPDGTVGARISLAGVL